MARRTWTIDGLKSRWEKLSDNRAYRYYLLVNKRTGKKKVAADFKVGDVTCIRYVIGSLEEASFSVLTDRAFDIIFDLDRDRLLLLSNKTG